jgi:glycosyltransferase involved in cell wall biosynthesis
MRVAYYSPLPPQRSGIADYSSLLLPALRRRVDIVLARPHRPSPSADIALFHLGNDPQGHGWIYNALRRRPGLLVLHEVALHGLVAGLTLGRGDRNGYLAAIEREGGFEGRVAAERALAGLDPPLWEARPDEFPLVREALDFAQGVIVHSKYAEREVRAAGFQGPLHRIPHPAASSEGRPEAQFPAGRSPVIGSLGKFNSAKRVPQLLRAFARLRRRFPEALLVFAGEGIGDETVRIRLEALELEAGHDVLLYDYVPGDEFRRLARGCDICVSLRGPTLGETSGSAIAALSVGAALVVSDVGWFGELPDSVAAKVAPDEWEIDHLSAVLELLASDRELRQSMGSAARSYVRSELDLEHTADGYARALEELVL